MAIWIFRAGKNGEYEDKFLTDNRIYLTWDELNHDLSKLNSKQDLLGLLTELYENQKKNTLRNWLGQIWPIAHSIMNGDLIVLPSKHNWTIHIAEVIGNYEFHSNAINPFFHSRKVKWIARDIPRSNFDQDLLYSFGAFMTVCRITRNRAEERLRIMQKNNWQNIVSVASSNIAANESDELEDDFVAAKELEQLAYDQITRRIDTNFKGGGMEILIEEILKAKGFVTWRTSGGPDKGVDILAAPEPMGFGSPRICVQVKSGNTPIDRPTLDQLIGAMQNMHAEQGLLVSWGGFKKSVEKETPIQFFKVRLWEQKEIIHELLTNYEKLSDSIKAIIPLKRIWMLSVNDDQQ